jgi:hypothetical protein
VQHPEDAARSLEEMMLLALVLGMLVLPLMFDVSFYLVLRDRFVLFHAVMVVAMMGYVLFAGGVISVLASLPVAFLAVMAPLCWAVGCGAALLFLSDFLERGALSRGMRRLTYWTGSCTRPRHLTTASISSPSPLRPSSSARRWSTRSCAAAARRSSWRRRGSR